MPSVDSDEVKTRRELVDTDFVVALQVHGLDLDAHVVVNADLAGGIKTFDTNHVVGGVRIEVDQGVSILIHTGRIEEGCQHDVVVDIDFFGIVGGVVAPFLEIEAVGRNGGDGGRGSGEVGACT